VAAGHRRPDRALPLRGHRQPYKLVSAPFRLGVSTALQLVGRRLAYPPADVLADIRARPAFASRRFRTRTRGVWRDRYGNRTA
jgi:hypothetical protein